MAKKEEKTNVCRMLEQKKIAYSVIHYEEEGFTSGMEIASFLGEDPEKVFKTLVTVGKSKEHFVFVLPVNEELDLKKAAKAVGEKSIEMLPQKELLPLTGYIHGGCSPIGMKKFFRTTIHESAREQEKIYFSGGKVGVQVQVRVEDLSKVIRFEYADLVI